MGVGDIILYVFLALWLFFMGPFAVKVLFEAAKGSRKFVEYVLDQWRDILAGRFDI